VRSRTCWRGRLAQLGDCAGAIGWRFLEAQRDAEAGACFGPCAQAPFTQARFFELSPGFVRRRRGALEVPDGHAFGARLERRAVREREPVLDDADAADRALVQQFPRIQQVCPFGELLLERDQHTQEILLIDRLIEVVAAEVDPRSSPARRA